MLLAVGMLVAVGPELRLGSSGGTQANGSEPTAPTIDSAETRASAVARRIRPPLRTRKGRIVDRNGRPVRLLSIALNYLGRGDGQWKQSERGNISWDFVPPTAYEDVQAWGFNSVRLLVSWANLEPVPPTRNEDGSVTRHWNEEYLTALDEAVEGFTSRGVAVILEMQQVRWSPAFTDLPLPGGRTMKEGWGLPKWLYSEGGLRKMVAAQKRFFIRGQHQRGFRNAWKFLVRRYADNTMVVGVDIMNEPYALLTGSYPGAKKLRPKHLKLARFYQRTGRAIRSVNPKLLLIFQEFKIRRLGMWSLTRKPRMKRAVMDNHFYAGKWENAGRRWLTEAHRRARSWNVPLWLGEFTVFNASLALPNRPGWRRSTRLMLADAKEKDIGWSIWLFGPGQFQIASDIRTPKRALHRLIRNGF